MAARRGMISSLAQYIHRNASVLVWKGRCIRAAGAPTQRYNALKAQRARTHTKCGKKRALPVLVAMVLAVCLFVRRRAICVCKLYDGSHCEIKCHVDDIPIFVCLIFKSHQFC